MRGVAPDLFCSGLSERAPGSRPWLQRRLKGSPNGHNRRLPWHRGSRAAACRGTGPRLLLIPVCPRRRQPGIYPAQELCRRGDPGPPPARAASVRRGPPGTSLHPRTEALGSLQAGDVMLAKGLRPSKAAAGTELPLPASARRHPGPDRSHPGLRAAPQPQGLGSSSWHGAGTVVTRSDTPTHLPQRALRRGAGAREAGEESSARAGERRQFGAAARRLAFSRTWAFGKRQPQRPSQGSAQRSRAGRPDPRPAAPPAARRAEGVQDLPVRPEERKTKRGEGAKAAGLTWPRTGGNKGGNPRWCGRSSKD